MKVQPARDQSYIVLEDIASDGKFHYLVGCSYKKAQQCGMCHRAVIEQVYIGLKSMSAVPSKAEANTMLKDMLIAPDVQ